MKFHTFFIDKKIEAPEITIVDSSLLNQWIRVLRFQIGSELFLSDGSGYLFLAKIVSLNRDSAVLAVLSKKKNENEAERKITLYQSLVKKDKLEWIFEKCTELGVSVFQPIISERSEKKDFNFERAKKIIKEASEQSQRSTLPLLHKVADLKFAIENSTEDLIVLHTDGEKIDVKNFSDKRYLGLLIGPEGGWTDGEISYFREKNIRILNLGRQILRSETAAISASALFLLG